jgi:hypothetical protein
MFTTVSDDDVLLTREEVIAVIERHDLDEHRDAVLAAVRPGYQLRPDRDGPHRIGGPPDLAPGEQWPVDAEGVPFTFVAQFDCSRLPPLTGEFPAAAWPHGGQLIRLFSALASDESAPCPAAALACPPDAPLTRSEAGPALHEARVQATPFLTAQQSWHVLGDGIHDGYDAFSAVLEAGGREPQPGAWTIPQLLGHATNEQGEDTILSAHYAVPDRTYRDWCTLFSLPSHDGMSFGDGGSLAVVILHEDLAQARYDRLWTDTSTG